MEFRVLQWIQANMRCRFLDALMPLVSAMGNGGVVWLLAAAAMTCSRTTAGSDCCWPPGL